MQLDLSVHTAFEENQSIATAAPVPSAVSGLAFELGERFSCQLRPVEITGADVRACDEQFAALGIGDGNSGVVHGENPGAGHLVADRQRGEAL